MFWNQFGDFIDLDPDPNSSNFVDPDPDTINPDPHPWKKNIGLFSLGEPALKLETEDKEEEEGVKKEELAEETFLFIPFN